jgi:predicted porin
LGPLLTLEKFAMKKTLIALAALAATTAFAQSTATISGSISVGVMDTGGATSKAAVSTLGGGANAINIVTVEDLGGGMRAGFDSQMRFNAATGDRNSAGSGAALFHGANVYVGGGFGTIRVGKIIEASNCGFDAWGCTGGAGMIAGHGTASGHDRNGVSGLIGAQSQAQSVSYATPTIGGFSASVQRTVGTRANERQVLNLSYAQGPLSVQFLQSKNTVNIAGTDAGAANILDGNGKGTSIGASYDFGVAKLNIFNAKTDKVTAFTGTPAGSFAPNNLDRDITGVTASMPMGAYTLLAGYAKDKKQAAVSDTKIAVGANYALSKRTTLGADLFKSDAVGAGTGFVVRARHTF